MNSAFAELEAEAAAWFDREGVPEAARHITRKASLRYKHQGFELDIDWPDGPVSAETVAAAIDGFHDLHEQLYTFAQQDTPVEIVTLHVAAVGTLLQPSLSSCPRAAHLRMPRLIATWSTSTAVPGPCRSMTARNCPPTSSSRARHSLSNSIRQP